MVPVGSAMPQASPGHKKTLVLQGKRHATHRQTGRGNAAELAKHSAWPRTMRRARRLHTLRLHLRCKARQLMNDARPKSWCRRLQSKHTSSSTATGSLEAQGYLLLCCRWPHSRNCGSMQSRRQEHEKQPRKRMHADHAHPGKATTRRAQSECKMRRTRMQAPFCLCLCPVRVRRLRTMKDTGNTRSSHVAWQNCSKRCSLSSHCLDRAATIHGLPCKGSIPNFLKLSSDLFGGRLNFLLSLWVQPSPGIHVTSAHGQASSRWDILEANLYCRVKSCCAHGLKECIATVVISLCIVSRKSSSPIRTHPTIDRNMRR